LSEQIAKWHGPSGGNCVLCGEVENCNHIFFSSFIAKVMWAGVREILHCDRNPARGGEFLEVSQGLSSQYRILVWFAFVMQSWALWNVRDKFTFEGSLISKPADVLYKMLLYMQQWWMLVRSRDRSLLDARMEAIRRLHTTLSAHTCEDQLVIFVSEHVARRRGCAPCVVLIMCYVLCHCEFRGVLCRSWLY
jgi:hypothetical protein